MARTRVIEFGKGAKNPTGDPETAVSGPWGQKIDGGVMEAADFGRTSARPKMNTREIWVLKNGGGGWDHPIHIHFEEGQILARNGSAANVPAWERGRKDVYRLRRAEVSRSHCSSAIGAACSWSIATTRCTKTTRCCCAGILTTKALQCSSHFPRRLPHPTV